MVLFDASAAQGDAQVIAQTVRKHLHAGADHVVAAVPMGSGFTDGVDHLVTLGSALADVTA